MSIVSAMVVEDSAVARELITNTLNSDPRIRVVCAVDTAEKALRLVPRLMPDIISMDVRLPGISGIEATRRIMAECPRPIIIVAADLSKETVNSSMEALRAGALSVVEKPTIDTAEAYRALARRLCDQFVNLSTVKVVRQRFNEKPAGRTRERPRIAAAEPTRAGGAIEIVGIVASTGGPPAVARLLQGLGAAFPVPILVVQHMGSAFLEGYAAWLDSVSDLTVTLAKDGEVPRPGRVYVGPGKHHLTYAGGRLRLIRDLSDRGHIPSGNMLFVSLAANAGAGALGVLLTGMGDDGATGLLAMREAGAYTIGQDRATSAVYGMPAAAKAIGGVVEELPLGAMPGLIAKRVAAAPTADAQRPHDSMRAIR
jgi:two-component system chemotaxis response regulator CheB